MNKTSYPNFPAVTAFTPEGRALIQILRFLLRGVSVVRGKAWSVPPELFNDDPRHFSTSDLLFFAYKYYFRSPLKSENWDAVEQFFIQNPTRDFGLDFFNFEKKGLDFEKKQAFFDEKTNKNTANAARQPVLLSQITLTAAGDLMPYEWIQPQYCQHLWDDIGDDFFDADVCFANLETPIDISHPASLVPEVMLTNMLFNGDAEMFKIFNGNRADASLHKARAKGERGFDVLSTANNHSLDMGESGLVATLDFLDNKEILHVGTARTPEEATRVTIIERNGIKLAFLAHTFSMNQFVNPDAKPFLVNHLEVNKEGVDLTPIRADVARAKAVGADLVVLSLHFGNAYQPFPSAHILKNAQRIFDECGVDMLLGGHPHNAQPTARYDFHCPFTGVAKRGFMIFSFGDFVAYDIFNWCHLAVYLKLTISKFALKNDQNTEGGYFHSKIENGGIKNGDKDDFSTQVIENEAIKNTETYTVLTDVAVKPVYTCGVYRSRNDRDLRFLDATKLWKQLENGEKPSFLTDWNVQEAQALKAFWDNFLSINLE